MRIAFFSTKPYDRQFFDAANEQHSHELTFFEPRLTKETLPLASGYRVICVFVNDTLDRESIKKLAQSGLKLIALRCAGFNNVDLNVATEFGVTVVRVPAYSPHAVAEHSVGLMLALNRCLHRAITACVKRILHSMVCSASISTGRRLAWLEPAKSAKSFAALCEALVAK